MALSLNFTPGITLNLDHYNSVYAENSKTAKTVSAETQVKGRTLGETLPFVIGTGRVDGHYFIGGISTVTTTTITTELVDQGTASDYFGIGMNSSSSGTGGPTYTTQAYGSPHIYKKVETPVTTTETVARAGYLFAYDPFERGYDLIRLEVDDNVIFDAENGIGANAEFRFYGGRQTTVDPILSDIIGANAGAYQNYVYVILDGIDADSPPRVSAIISNAASAQPTGGELSWTAGSVANLASLTTPGRTSAYDPTDGLLYQILTTTEVPSASALLLSVLDTNTRSERYRVALADSSAYASGSGFILAMRGTGHVLVRAAIGSESTSPTRIYNAVTGKVVAEWSEASTESIFWRCGSAFDGRYVFIGTDSDASGDTISSFYGVADLAASTFSVESDTAFDIGNAVRGRTGNGTISFFITQDGVTDKVYELTFDGDTWTRALAYDANGDTYGLHYDSKTGYLIVSVDEGGGTHRIAYVNPDSALLVDSFTDTQSYTGDESQAVVGYERFWAKPGYALFQRIGTDDVYLLDIGAKTFTLFATDPTASNQGVKSGIWDQFKLAYYYGRTDDVWTEYRLPNTSPGLIDLEDIVTDVVSIAGFGPGDLTVEGFTGVQTYGFVINADTTVQNVLKGLGDVFDFTFCDTGSGFFFKKAGRDGSLSIDVALTSADMVDRDGGAAQSRDEANLRTPAAVELEYVSKDSAYRPLSAPFSMPTGVLNSIRTEKYSTPVVMTDAQGQQFATEKFFELQKRRREHNVIVAPEYIDALPGDIITFPSGLISYTARIEEMAIELRNMAVEIRARDFQTEVATTITSVSNNGGVVQLISFASQYIHLDVPLFRYSDDLGGAALVQYGVIAPRGQANWSGGVLYRGETQSSLSPLVDQAPHQGVIAVCTDTLGNPIDPFATTDTSAVTVRKVAGSASLLTNKTQAQVEAGENNAFIGAAGRWEWVGFTTVTDNGDNTYTLAGFVRRGYRGTEVFCGDHAINDVFVLISPEWLRKTTNPLADLDQTRYYKALGIGQSSAAGTTLPHVIRGAAETPYAPINLFAAIGGSPGGIDLDWDYRSRLATGTNPSNHGEASLSFEIDIMDGATVKRTLTSTTNSVNYTDAQIIADWGSYPDSITFRVYMMSAVVGRGYQAQATIPLTYDLTADTTVILADTTYITADQE